VRAPSVLDAVAVVAEREDVRKVEWIQAGGEKDFKSRAMVRGPCRPAALATTEMVAIEGDEAGPAPGSGVVHPLGDRSAHRQPDKKGRSSERPSDFGPHFRLIVTMPV
jgi:hypothetical protein